MAIITTEAIVLRAMDHRETSKIGFFLTKKSGRMIGVLKGIRKDPRKFGSSVDKFSVNDIVVYQYRDREIHLVSQCDMKEFFFAVREDARKITAAEYGAELVSRILPLEEPAPLVYGLLLDYFRSLGNERDLSRLVRMFQIKLLSLSGFRPHVETCVRCRGEVRGQARFSSSKGGLVCSACQGKEPGTSLISAGAVASLLYIEKHNWQDCLKLSIPKSLQKELGDVLNNFLVFHIGHQVRSQRYLLT